MATPGIVTVRITGDKELRAKLQDRRADGPVNQFLDRGAFYIEGEAKRNAPVDTGHLRRSIATATSGHREREVGTSTPYGPHIEFGTRPHFPPPDALNGWARRHGFGGNGGFLVARKIAKRGTQPQPYMGPAAESGERFVKAGIPALAAAIEQAMS